ncbi:MAG TPA: DUF6786 family protein, partial [Chitinophagaceae bacterium]|nr:DUF6786 family protein [Chitinophagaceae bacterium]
MNKYLLIAFTMLILSCNDHRGNSSSSDRDTTNQDYPKGSFGYDLHFLKQYHKDLVVLSDDSSSAEVIIAPAYQGRVMTSTAAGNNGLSFG